MKESNFERNEFDHKNNNDLEKKESKEKVNPEYILYHNAIRLELKEGEPLEFFAPKSEITSHINQTFDDVSEQLIEIRFLMESENFPRIKELLLDTYDVWYLDGRRQKIVEQLKDLLQSLDLPHIKKLVTIDASILKLRWLLEDQLGDKNLPTTTEQLKQIKDIRDSSYFLTKEDQSFRGYGLVAFDIQRLLKFGFEIHEANNEVSDSIARGFDTIHEVRKYLDSLKTIRSSDDCLQYHHGLEDNYEAGTTNLNYIPYCPEYLVIPPSADVLAKLVIEFNDEIDDSVKNLDPKKTENYQVIVNALFNDSIIEKKLS